MAKRPGSGGRRKGSGRPHSGGRNRSRKGRHARIREKTGGAKGRAEKRRSRPSHVGPDEAREGLVRESGSPSVGGQSILAEDAEGRRWRVECLGEPVEVGARILFQPLGPEAALRGEMVRLLEASRESWVCTLRRGHAGIRLTPFGGLEAPELLLAEKDAKGAEDGTRVVVVPVSRGRGEGRSRSSRSRGAPSSRRRPVRVVEILGPPYDPDSDHRALVWKHRLATDPTRRARLEAAQIEASIASAELDRRVDLRTMPFVTIDPASARDHDDAVYAERRSPPAVSRVDESGRKVPEGSSEKKEPFRWKLWVAIADVAHYVEEAGWIDAEARRRGNSFYFPDRSIPMLPERLSSDLCSLRPEVDRLAMVVELSVDGAGRVADARFHEAVIRSQARLAYEDAAEWLDASEAGEGDPGSKPGGSGPVWIDSLRVLGAVSGALEERRARDGAISLELPELEIQTDANGRAIDAHLRGRNRAHRLIEEAMLAANRAVARALDVAERKTIHRVHPPPSPSRLDALRELLDRLALAPEEDLAAPGVLARVLDEVRGTQLEERVHGAVLRSMSQARYEAESRGHYALRFDHYAHFTSPIRRYADLEVHRALKALIRGEPARASATSGIDLAGLAIWLSGRERVATEVERDAEALACCAIMDGRMGERFDAVVTAATEFGLFVRLDAPVTSGLVPMRWLEGEWIHDPDAEALVARRSGGHIGLGDRLVVELANVDADRMRIAFRMCPGTPTNESRKPAR